MSIIWLASYPKSGNTWVRVFLTNYIDNHKKPADINKLTTGSTLLARSLFDDTMGLPSSDMTANELNHYRPIYHRHVFESTESPTFFKSHSAYPESGTSLFAINQKSKAIHLVRNPLDIAVSYAHHLNKSIDFTIKEMANPDSVSPGGAFYFDELMSNWSEHTYSWLSQREVPILTLRYEDMLTETEKCFGDIIAFSNLHLCHKRLKKAIRFSQFELLCNQEAQQGYSGKQPTAISFFRKGLANDWKTRLSNNQAQEIISTHRHLMEQFGYETRL